MEEMTGTTLENIQKAALAEFLEKGFLGASLRQIVKNAGVTTGAFYGYFSSKEALFASIVEPHAAALMGRFMDAQTTFAELPEAEQIAHMGEESGACVRWMVDYICEHREPVKLLLCRAEGTSYEHFVHNMVEVFSAGRKAPATSISSTTWWRLRWNTPSATWKCCAVLAGMSRNLAGLCAISLPAACLTGCLRS